MPTSEELHEKRNAAKEVIDILEQISHLLNTGLNRAQLSMCVSVIENGANPDALATIIKDLQSDQEAAQAQARPRSGAGSP